MTSLPYLHKENLLALSSISMGGLVLGRIGSTVVLQDEVLAAIRFTALCGAIVALFVQRGGCDFSFRFSSRATALRNKAGVWAEIDCAVRLSCILF